MFRRRPLLRASSNGAATLGSGRWRRAEGAGYQSRSLSTRRNLVAGRRQQRSRGSCSLRPPPGLRLRRISGREPERAEERSEALAIALELDPAYVDVAALRWQAFTGGEAEELRDVVEHFPISQDQRNTVAAQIRFEPHRRVWFMTGLRYGSGLPVELEDEDDDAEEEGEEGEEEDEDEDEEEDDEDDYEDYEEEFEEDEGDARPGRKRGDWD